MEQIQNLKVDSIHPSGLNPRKFFDPASMAELSNNIKVLGILQPITVRPKGDGYEIICGERRWRAAQMAELETIPTIVRDLTDDEAMDVAITENLQRKDIDPFEEADAFRYLLDKKQTFDDIAARFGKSTVFVRGRVKLLDLINPLRALYNEKAIPVSHCLELSKFSAELQTKIYEEHYQKESHYSSWHNHSMRQLRNNLDSNFFEKLKGASFNTADCKQCPNNTAACGLFEDERGVLCSDKECYKRKTIEHRVAKIHEYYEKAPEIILFSYYTNGSLNEAVYKQLKEDGIPYYSDNQYYIKWSKDKPKKAKDQTDEEFAEEVKEYEEYQAQIEKEIAEGKLFRARRIDDNSFGEKVVVYLRDGKKAPAESSPEMKIKELQGKDSRNAELAIEKSIELCRALFGDIGVEDGKELSDLERGIAIYLMSGYAEQRNMLKSSVDETLTLLKNITPEQCADICRYFIKNKLSTYGHGIDSRLWIEFAREHFPEQVAEIEDKQQKIYEKRKAGIDARIEELELERKAKKILKEKKKSK